MRLAFVTLDVFTTSRYCGNPLAVVHDADALSTEQMQAIAREFNLSETIFVMKPQDAANTAKVRIFLPGAEIPFAGHPTIGCAIHLAERRHKPGCAFETDIRLEENVGLVPVRVSRIGGAAFALLTAPSLPSAAAPVPGRGTAAQALSLPEAEIGFDGHAVGGWQAGPRFVFIPVASLEALAACRVAEPAWSAMTGAAGAIGAYVYTRAAPGSGAHYRARMFAPGVGIAEDPATGAATVMLAAQLLASGELKDGGNRVALQQGYEMGRPSELVLEADCSGDSLIAIRVGGQAVPVMEGSVDV
jgi:trans-2,3-dihydro-3-hydroxyanthranilate isomerase